VNEPPNLCSAYSGVRALVLGASGFIGRWVARYLSKSGAELFLGVRDETTAARILPAYGIHGTVLKLDAWGIFSPEKMLAKVRPAVTFNLIGYGVDRSEQDLDNMHRINAELVGHLSDAVAACRSQEWKGCELVHAGSLAEYGPIAGNMAEESIPQPSTPYGKTKLAGTQALAEHCSASRMRGITARLATVYGPGEHAGRLLPSLIGAVQRGEAPALSAGSQKRDFTYVQDVAEGLLRLGLSSADPATVVNLATGKLTSVREFAETAAGVLGVPKDRLRFGAVEVRADEEMTRSSVSIERLKGLTGWIPSTTIDQGIQKTVHFLNLRP